MIRNRTALIVAVVLLSILVVGLALIYRARVSAPDAVPVSETTTPATTPTPVAPTTPVRTTGAADEGSAARPTPRRAAPATTVSRRPSPRPSTRKPTPSRTPAKTPRPSSPSPSEPVTGAGYSNCDELRVDYPVGVPKTHPAYRAKFDRDGDGWACETE